MKIGFRGLEFQDVVKHMNSYFQDAWRKFKSLDEVTARKAIVQKRNLKRVFCEKIFESFTVTDEQSHYLSSLSDLQG